MSVIRVNKTRDYTVMSNYHLRDDRLSLKAVGLMSWMLSLPDNWNFTTEGITKCRKEGRDAIRGALKELEEAGYLVIEYGHKKDGKFSTSYTLYEQPKTVDNKGKKAKPQRKSRNGKTASENPTQINTITTNTKEKESKKDGCRQSYEEIINSLVEDPNVREALQAYLQMRVMQKKAPSNNALILLVERLKELSSKPGEQVSIINQSIRGGYPDFYSLKKQSSSTSRGTKRQPKRDAIMKPIDMTEYYLREDGTYDLSRFADGRKVPVF